jgi:hypothetical protein
MKYSIAMIKPPNISQIRFPKKFITSQLLIHSRIRVLSLGYLTE